MENVKIEINMNELLELAERCGNYYTENCQLLDEQTTLKEQIKHLKFKLMEFQFIRTGEITLDPTNHFLANHLLGYIKCGITYDEIMQFLELKIESEKVHENGVRNANGN